MKYKIEALEKLLIEVKACKESMCYISSVMSCSDQINDSNDCHIAEMLKRALVCYMQAHVKTLTGVSLLGVLGKNKDYSVLSESARTYFELSGDAKIEGSTYLYSFCRLFKDEIWTEKKVDNRLRDGTYDAIQLENLDELSKLDYLRKCCIKDHVKDTHRIQSMSPPRDIWRCRICGQEFWIKQLSKDQLIIKLQEELKLAYDMKLTQKDRHMNFLIGIVDQIEEIKRELSEPGGWGRGLAFLHKRGAIVKKINAMLDATWDKIE